MSRLFHFRRTNIEVFKTTWQASKLFRVCLLVSFIPWLLFTALPFFRLMPSEETGKFIPLHYNIFFGVDKFGPWYSVFELSIFGLVVLFLNTWLAAKYFERERALSGFFSATAFLVQILLLAAMYFTILLNM